MSDLEIKSTAIERFETILTEGVLNRIELLAVELRDKSAIDIQINDLNGNPDLALFIAFINAFGGLTIEHEKDKLRILATSPLAKNVAYVFFLFLRHGFHIFEDWTRRCRTLPNEMCAVEFLHHMETQRIEQSKRSGFIPEVIEERPVAFAIIKAFSEERGQPVYLLECNKDWQKYNFIGGKQEPQDGGDYRVTLLREIEEEIGAPRRDVQLTQLTGEVLHGYSLSGSRATLAHYPCMLYLAHFQKPITLKDKDKWFTEEELRKALTQSDSEFLINPVYLT